MGQSPCCIRLQTASSRAVRKNLYAIVGTRSAAGTSPTHDEALHDWLDVRTLTWCAFFYNFIKKIYKT